MYGVIFRMWKPSAYSVRFPLLLLYASTIWVLFALLRAVHSWRAGAVGALLLATDPTYMLTACFGWCSFQNVLLVTAFAFFTRFHLSGRRRWLAAAAFCTGLWLWDKALSLWLLGGFVVAVAIVFPREGLRYFKLRNLAVALPAFFVGALPLIVYNVTHEFVTFRSNTHFSTAEFEHKLEILRLTANGSAWLGYLVNNEATSARDPMRLPERWSASLHDRSGQHRQDYMPYAFLVAVFLIPALWLFRARPPGLRFALVCLIALGAAWIQMALTKGAGTGGHHPALLWPIPQLFIGLLFAEASFRWKAVGPWILAAFVAFLVAGNVITVNQYLYQLVRFGPATIWTDAIFSLSNGITKFNASTIFIADWGVFNPLTALHEGTLPLRWATDPFMTDNASESQRKDASLMFAEENAIWIAHTENNEVFKGINAHLEKLAGVAGYRRVIVETFQDRNGRRILEVFRLVREGAPAAVLTNSNR